MKPSRPNEASSPSCKLRRALDHVVGDVKARRGADGRHVQDGPANANDTGNGALCVYRVDAAVLVWSLFLEAPYEYVSRLLARESPFVGAGLGRLARIDLQQVVGVIQKVHKDGVVDLFNVHGETLLEDTDHFKGP